jgi:hypothetical protein
MRQSIAEANDRQMVKLQSEAWRRGRGICSTSWNAVPAAWLRTLKWDDWLNFSLPQLQPSRNCCWVLLEIHVHHLFWVAHAVISEALTLGIFFSKVHVVKQPLSKPFLAWPPLTFDPGRLQAGLWVCDVYRLPDLE